MTVVSGTFLLFVLVTSLLYFLVSRKWRWLVLLLASYVFYWMNSGYLLIAMVLTSLFTFFIGFWLDKNNKKLAAYLAEKGKELSSSEKKAAKLRKKKINRRILLLGVFVDLGVLIYLKYFNFFAGNVNKVFGLFNIDTQISFIKVMLPLGISFYTLQAIAYITDIYREKYEADNNPLKFMLFMSYFPQITQGPIARHDQLAAQLYEGHPFDYTRVTQGVQLALWGFMKKLIIADRIAIPTNEIFNNFSEYTGVVVFLAAVGYGIQVYADFSGGMDIVRGVSQIFGIELAINFKQPYFAKSIEEFWRRWHITLGAWMKDYVFYPLSLSKFSKQMGKIARKLFGSNIGKKIPAFFSMFIVYFLVGFWHGAEWKYIIYGVWNGVFITLGILLEDKYALWCKKLRIDVESVTWKGFQMLRTFVLCSIGRFFSRAGGSRAAFAMIVAMFKDVNPVFLVDGSLVDLGLTTANWIVLVIAVVVMLAVDVIHEKGIEIRKTIAQQNIIFRWIIYYAAILAVAIFGMYGASSIGAVFIYQQF